MKKMIGRLETEAGELQRDCTRDEFYALFESGVDED